MNTKLFLLALISIMTLSATTTEAYTAGAKSAEKLGDNYRLYSVAFSWSFADKDLYIPVLAKRDLSSNTTEKALGYRIESPSGLKISHGTTTAMVVADLPIENGYYKLKAGEKAKFLLLALHESASTTQPLRLKVSALPFILKSQTKESQSSLNTTELKGYATNSI